MECEFKREEGGKSCCQIAEKWSGLPIVETTSDACRVCQSMKDSKAVNRVTVSIACGQARKESEELFRELLQRAKPFITDPSLAERAGRYMSSTENWVRAGSPVRDDEEVKEILKTCNSCEQFVHNNDNTGSCKVCGCALNMMGGMFNKARRATEHCPLGKW